MIPTNIPQVPEVAYTFYTQIYFPNLAVFEIALGVVPMSQLITDLGVGGLNCDIDQ